MAAVGDEERPDGDHAPQAPFEVKPDCYGSNPHPCRDYTKLRAKGKRILFKSKSSSTIYNLVHFWMSHLVNLSRRGAIT